MDGCKHVKLHASAVAGKKNKTPRRSGTARLLEELRIELKPAATASHRSRGAATDSRLSRRLSRAAFTASPFYRAVATASRSMRAAATASRLARKAAIGSAPDSHLSRAAAIGPRLSCTAATASRLARKAATLYRLSH